MYARLGGRQGEGETKVIPPLGLGRERMTGPGFEGGVSVPWLEGAIEGVGTEAELA